MMKEEHRLRVSENRVLRRIFLHKMDEENCIMSVRMLWVWKEQFMAYLQEQSQKMMMFSWVVTPCGLVGRYQCFRNKTSHLPSCDFF
jgi:hypothetical protein